MSKNYDSKLRCKYSKNMNEIEIINGKARDEDLTYGQYVAKYGLYSNRNKFTVAQKEKAEKEEKMKKEAKRETDEYVKNNKGKLKWWEVMV